MSGSAAFLVGPMFGSASSTTRQKRRTLTASASRMPKANVVIQVHCSSRVLLFTMLFTQGIVTWMMIAGILQSIASFLVLVFYLMKTAPILWRKAQARFYEQASNDYNLRNLFGLKKLANFVISWSYGIKNILSDYSVFYYFIYTVAAVFGVLLVTNPKTYWVSNVCVMLLLFDLVFRAPVLHHIVNALWRPRIAILLALVLFLIIEYIFTLLAYYSFPQDYRGQCDSLKACLMVTIDNTFKVTLSLS